MRGRGMRFRVVFLALLVPAVFVGVPEESRVEAGVPPGLLRVITSPAVASQVVVDGVARDTWGLDWMQLPEGTYEVAFSDLEGFTTPSLQTVTVTSGQTTTVTGSFAARGWLRVITSPAVAATISVDGIPRNDWGVWTDFVPGDYQVCFGDVTDHTTPPCQTATVTPGGTTVVTGSYVSNPGSSGPAGFGMLRVVTSPAVASQILVDGVAGDTWGLNWMKLPPGTYEVSFRDVPGFTTPAPQTVTVDAGATTAVTGAFTPRGWLRAITAPAVAATISVDGIPRNDWGMWTDLAPGDYQVCFGPAAGFNTPACETATVNAGTTTVTGTYPIANLGDLRLGAEVAAGGFQQPILATARPGDARLIVADQPGVVYAVDLGSGQQTVVLDISSLVLFTGEQGLLGVAFDPNDPDRMVAHYTANDGSTAVVEYMLVGGIADTASRRVILTHPQPATNHNGGMIDFGPDGYLYIALGDGGGGGDPFDNGQNPFTLLGAILRIDLDSGVPYGIPPDNPFADGVSGAPEVWAYGLRNPWRFAFDGTDLWVGDVGQGAWEEIDLFDTGRPGDNAGWPLLEGTHCFQVNPCNIGGLLAPIAEYGHAQGRCSVTGGVVYRGAAIPELTGTYIYGDFCSGELWGLRTAPFENTLLTGAPVGLPALNFLTSFGIGPDGEVYLIQAAGTVWRLVRA